MRWLASLAIVAACGRGSPPDVPITPPPRAPDPIAPGFPGGLILHIAVTESADAALTLDDLGAVRLWPTFDGRRPPVRIAATDVVKIAIAHAGNDLLLALLDKAGVVRLLRVGLDGAIRGQVQLAPNGIAYTKVVAIDGGVILLREDDSIERYDAAGAPHGKIRPEAGEQIGALATRGGATAVLIVDPSEAAPQYTSTMRWLDLHDGLQWGATITLPTAILGTPFALSPNHRRIGALDERTKQLDVIELVPTPHLLDGPSIQPDDVWVVGFADDDHCGVLERGVQWWSPMPGAKHDDIKSPTGDFVSGRGEGAVGNGLAIVSSGGALALTTLTAVTFLGWQEATGGPDGLAVIGSRIAMSVGDQHALWLDDHLTYLGDNEPERPTLHSRGAWIDDHHVVGEVRIDERPRLQLIDTTHPDQPTTLATVDPIHTLEYDAVTRVLAVFTKGRIERYGIDVTHMTATPLPSLEVSGAPMVSVWLLDPARADGIVAMVIDPHFNGEDHLLIFRNDRGGSLRRSKDTVLVGFVEAVDATGTVYISDRGSLIARHEDHPDIKLPSEMGNSTISEGRSVFAISHDTQRIAKVLDDQLVVYDPHGTVVWRHPVPGGTVLIFTDDDQRLIVYSTRGIVALEMKTGAVVATACGFDFGLHTKMPSLSLFGATTFCEAPP